MTTSFTNTRLFGGAITADLPSDFADVSTIRQIPDTQEVFLQQTSLTSLLFDITERASPPAYPHCTTDAEALLFHFEDYCAAGTRPDRRTKAQSRIDADGGDEAHEDEHEHEEEEEEERKIWMTGAGSAANLRRDCSSNRDISVHTLLASATPRHARTARTSDTIAFTALLFTLVRLRRGPTDADVLVVLNVPHLEGGLDAASLDWEGGRWGPEVLAALAVRDRVLASLEVRDWGLFGGEEEGGAGGAGGAGAAATPAV